MNWVVTTIVVPSDGSMAAEPQLVAARAIARATGARIVVAHVNEIVPGHMATHALHPCEDLLESTVRQQVKGLQAAGVRAELAIVASTAEISRGSPTSHASKQRTSSSPEGNGVGRCPGGRSAVFHDD